MTEESQLQLVVPAKSGDSSVSLSKVRSGLIARGRSDAAILTIQLGAESEEERTGLLAEFQDWYDFRPTEEVRRDAERGGAKQQSSLAFKYSIGGIAGGGVGKDLAEAARWCRKAADQGYPYAQFYLGLKYDIGQGVAQDCAEAARWYRKAADQGVASAQLNLGAAYDAGQGVAQDYAEAARWYRKAADQGLNMAQFNLGLKYDKGQGVGQDHAEAAKWYRKAADQRLGKAQFNLGLKYDSGLGVARDYVQAHMWVSMATTDASVDDQERYAAVRDRIAAKMTPAQILEAQRLATRRNAKPPTSIAEV
jgi:TPR repeat protein